MKNSLPVLLALGVLTGLVTPVTSVHGGEAVDLSFFAFNEAGPTRGVSIPAEFSENLAARPEGLAPAPAQTVAWSEVFQPRSRPLLVAIQITLGSRIELLALLVDSTGVVRLAARRPASTLFNKRLDEGEPGSGEALVNAWRELAADIHWARQRQPAGAQVSPVRVNVKNMTTPGSTGGIGLQGGELTPGSSWVIEAMTLAALAMEGRPAVPGDPADLTIRAKRYVVFDLSVDGPEPCVKRSVRQEDLFPALRMIMRKHLFWGRAVSDAQVVDPAWEPVAVAGVSTSQVAVSVGGAIVAFSAADGRACAPQSNLWARAGIPEALRARVAMPSDLPASPVLGPLIFGTKNLLLTRSRRALFVDSSGRASGEWLFPDRLHDAVPVCEGDLLRELVLIDVAGAIWTWQPGQDAPVRRIELRVRPNGPLVLAPAFIADWNNVPADAAEDAGGVMETGRILLIGTIDGFLIHVPYPLRRAP
jgi:hypothetical protein